MIESQKVWNSIFNRGSGLKQKHSLSYTRFGVGNAKPCETLKLVSGSKVLRKNYFGPVPF